MTLHSSGARAANTPSPQSAAMRTAPPGPGNQIGSAANASAPAVSPAIAVAPRPETIVEGGLPTFAGNADPEKGAALDGPVAEGGLLPCAGDPGHVNPAAFGDDTAGEDFGPRAAFASDITNELRDYARQRRFLIRTQSRAARSIESYIASCLGSGLLPKGERQKVYVRAAALIEIVGNEVSAKEKDQARAEAARAALPAFDAVILDRNYEMILTHVATAAPVSDMRTRAEDEMRALAQTLPAWPFVDGVLGVSDLALAVIVGEAGDPTAYRDKHTLCKRLGLGVVDGMRQGNPGSGATNDDWTRHGYNRERCADVWVFLSNAMIRGQYRAARDEDGERPEKSGKPIAAPAHAIGPYGEIYRARKQYETLRNRMGAYADQADAALRRIKKPTAKQRATLEAGQLLPGHIDARARRYASKAFIRDLRNAWRNATRDA